MMIELTVVHDDGDKKMVFNMAAIVCIMPSGDGCILHGVSGEDHHVYESYDDIIKSLNKYHVSILKINTP